MKPATCLIVLTLCVLASPVTAGQLTEATGHDTVQITNLMSSGFTQAQSGQVADAQSSFRSAMVLAETALGSGSLEYARLNLEAGVRLLNTREPSAAREFLFAAHEMLYLRLGQSHYDTALAALYLGAYWVSQDRALRALPLLQSSRAVFARSNDSSKLVEAHVLIARALEEVDRSEQATPHLHRIGQLIAEGYGTRFEEQPIYAARARYFNNTDGCGVVPGPCFQNPRESRVTLAFDVDGQGFVSNIRVVVREGDQRFAQAAMKALEQFRYAPRIVDGRAVGREDVTFTFDTAET